MNEQLTLDSRDFKALASDSRKDILKYLKERNCTLTELASKMNMSSPSVKQHLDILIESGLIELKDEGRKWKYYSLSRKGKTISSPEKSSNILIILSIASIALVGILLMFSSMLVSLGGSQQISSMQAQKSFDQVQALNEVLSDSVEGASSSAIPDVNLSKCDEVCNCVYGFPCPQCGECMDELLRESAKSNE